MNEEDTPKTTLDGEQTPDAGDFSENGKEFALGEFKVNPISSAETVRDVLIKQDIFAKETAQTDAAKETENPIFKLLAEPKLPALPAENRARLQMQSPTRLHFYWSIKDNPFETLHRVFGGNSGNYRLVVKLLNQTHSREEIFPVEAEGAWWFDVDADSAYRAELGFYAPNRPFVRLMFSNAVETPRKNPSTRQESDADWAISADSFAQVLDNSGFVQDAFEVALAGDDAEFADTATRSAFANFFGEAGEDFLENDSSEMRFALLALASGYSLEDLRAQISPRLFVRLQENAENLSAEKAIAALQEHFGDFTDETASEESLTPTVFGASLINFSRVSKRKFLPKLTPVSSSKVAKSFR